MRAARVELVRVGATPPPEFFALAGNCQFQVCRASVHIESRTARVALFWPADGEPTSVTFDELAEPIEREPVGTVPVIVRDSSERAMSIETPSRQLWCQFAIAAVAAAARISWAWDDGPIAVTLNQQQFTIDGDYTGSAWQMVEITDRAV